MKKTTLRLPLKRRKFIFRSAAFPPPITYESFLLVRSSCERRRPRQSVARGLCGTRHRRFRTQQANSPSYDGASS